MTDVVNPKSTSPDQLLPYHKKISAEGKALMICFISYTYMVLKSTVSSAFLLFFQSYSLYNISFFRAKKGNKTAFRAIGGNFGQYREIFLFYLVAIQNRLCYNFIRQQKDNRVCHVAHKKNEPPESSGVLPGVLPLFGEVNRLG